MATVKTSPQFAPAYTPDTPIPDAVASRIGSIDFVRGLVMILMAIDHVRVYSGVPAGGPTFGVFFTRWVTHLVAPVFVFLAGTAAFLHGQKLGNRVALSRFLLTRGLWLVLLELTVVRVAWTFNVDFAHYLLAGVIWMIGWCMVLMAAVVYLPLVAIGVVGVGIIVGHNVMDYVQGSLAPLLLGSGSGWLWKILYVGGAVELGGSGGPPLLILYVLFPRIGVMMAGYAFGAVMRMPADRRRTVCLRLGAAAVALFLVLRGIDAYGDPRHWHGNQGSAVLRFLATTKYPASLLFLLMTLGPMFLLLPYVERTRGRLAQAVTTFGRVPFFYYLLHIPLIHAAACLVSLVREGRVNPWLFGNHPLAPPDLPAGYMWSLPLLYCVFVLCVAALYIPCRWYATLKATRRSRWLSYL